MKIGSTTGVLYNFDSKIVVEFKPITNFAFFINSCAGIEAVTVKLGISVIVFPRFQILNFQFLYAKHQRILFITKICFWVLNG